MIFRIGNTAVRSDGRTLSWTSGLEADADGAPRAYAPAHSGLPTLDALGNAGKPGAWYGLACDEHEVPYIQSSEDPAPGYYVSTTALGDTTKSENHPSRYVDSSIVPYISVPPIVLKAGARKGDLCIVSYRGKNIGAIVADVGPGNKIGEGSIALIQALGADPFRAMPKHHLVGIDNGVSFTILLGTASTPAWPRSLDEIAAVAVEVAA